MTDIENQLPPTVPAAEAPNTPAPVATPEHPEPEPQAEGQGEDQAEGAQRPIRMQRYQQQIALLTAAKDNLLRQANTALPTPEALDRLPDQPPRESDFKGDRAAYERALTAFNAAEAVRAAVRGEDARERLVRLLEVEVEILRERELAHLDRVEQLKRQIPDFGEAMKAAAAIDMRDDVLDEIVRSEKSALIHYHLAKNPDRARELNGLTGRELARAIGRLEGAVRLPARRATGATPPVQPLTGATGPSFDPHKAEMTAYAADYKRRQQARAR